jgi:hypothetical protein
VTLALGEEPPGLADFVAERLPLSGDYHGPCATGHRERPTENKHRAVAAEAERDPSQHGERQAGQQASRPRPSLSAHLSCVQIRWTDAVAISASLGPVRSPCLRRSTAITAQCWRSSHQGQADSEHFRGEVAVLRPFGRVRPPAAKNADGRGYALIDAVDEPVRQPSQAAWRPGSPPDASKTRPQPQRRSARSRHACHTRLADRGCRQRNHGQAHRSSRQFQRR